MTPGICPPKGETGKGTDRRAGVATERMHLRLVDGGADEVGRSLKPAQPHSHQTGERGMLTRPSTIMGVHVVSHENSAMISKRQLVGADFLLWRAQVYGNGLRL